MAKPFLPNEIRSDHLKLWRRSVLALTIATKIGRTTTIDAVAKRLWGDEAGARVVKAAVSPATLAGQPALAATLIGEYLRSLRPQSAAARLFDAAQRINMERNAYVSLPGKTADFPAPMFVGEGGAMPVVQGSFGAVTLGPPRKLAFIAGMTGELIEATADVAEAIITAAMDEAAAKALDSAVFSDAAADDVRPAGLFHGVMPITATSGGGDTAMDADIRNLVGAIGDAGAGHNVIIFANPRQAVWIGLRVGARFDIPVVSTPALPAGTITAIEAGAIASGFDALPETQVSNEATLHFEDTAPAQIGTTGAPAVVAAPVRSLWQSDLVAVRMILRCAWANRLAGGVQLITGTSW